MKRKADPVSARKPAGASDAAGWKLIRAGSGGGAEGPVEARMDAIASSRPAIPSCPGPAPARH